MGTLSLEEVLGRALRLRCPRCGTGKLFAGWFRMHENCTSCELKYEREPGFFLGSAYINYGITAVVVTATYMGLHFGAGYSNQALTVPLGTFIILFPLLFFRYARSLWLAMDLFWDRDP